MIVLVHLRRLEKHLMQLWEMQLLIRKRKMLKRQDQPNLIKLVYLYPRNANKYLYIIIHEPKSCFKAAVVASFFV